MSSVESDFSPSIPKISVFKISTRIIVPISQNISFFSNFNSDYGFWDIMHNGSGYKFRCGKGPTDFSAVTLKLAICVEFQP